MDQAQIAAEPLKPVTAAALVRQMREPDAETLAALSPEAQDNRQRAATELSMIFELKESRAFQWFQKEFIDPLWKDAFDKLRNPKLRSQLGAAEALELIQAKYVALREVRSGILEREIAHRELLDASDEEIPLIRERLERL